MKSEFYNPISSSSNSLNTKVEFKKRPVKQLASVSSVDVTTAAEPPIGGECIKTASKPSRLKGAEITFLENVRRPHDFANKKFITVLNCIKNGKYEKEINILRGLDEQAYKDAKLSLPAIAANGLFSNKVTNDNFLGSTGFAGFDVDRLDASEVDKFKARIAELAYVVCCFVSPSGKGLKIFIRVNPDEVKSDKDFKRLFAQVNKSFDAAGITLDQSCKDVRRLCFVSYDPDIYINWDATEFVMERPKASALSSVLPNFEIDPELEAKQIESCVAILRNATPGNRHDLRLTAGIRGGGLIAGKQVNEQNLMDALFRESDRIADGGLTNESERKTIFDAIERGKSKPIYPVQEIFNETLDIDRIDCKANLIDQVADNHILKKISIQLAEEARMPVNTVFLIGLAIYSSMAARKYVVLYLNKQLLPLGLYVVVEQPSGTGKSRCLNFFKQPFRKIQKEAEENVLMEIQALEARSKTLKPADEQNAVLGELKRLAERLNIDLFVTNPTPEGLESTLKNSNGCFSVASSEQGLFNALFGYLYSNKGSNNNDVVLNGYDGGHICTVRAGRRGYNGFVVGSVVCFAQQGSIEKVFAASNGTGLAERFLMLAEPHNLGLRDHTQILEFNSELKKQYDDICEFFTEVVTANTSLNELHRLHISKSGFLKIKQFQNKIEPYLCDGGKYSHLALRGAASKVDMQIMKIAAVLHVMDSEAVNDKDIADQYVESAIGIAGELLEASLKLCQDKGIIGRKAEYRCIINYLTSRAGGKTKRDIVNSVRKTLPFRDYTGSSTDLIQQTLDDMVKEGLICGALDQRGATVYCLAQ